MQQTDGLKQQYENLEWSGPIDDESVVQSDSLLTFPYEYSGSDTEVSIDTDEFTAVCPWTGLPDFSTVIVSYVPDKVCLELRAYKFYLMSYRTVGMVQEHITRRILNDLVEAVQPLKMSVKTDYKIRGGIHTVCTAEYEKE